jgi:16S rRNA (guanine(966)-N(2))-methyltransferase RsmD
MMDRTKETCFNIIGGLVTGKHVLDLFAGSGSLGLEALSRGALSATFVDRADWAVRVIHRNIQSLGLEARGRVLEGDVLRMIRKLENEGRFFSVIFVDPPYQSGLVKKTLLRLDQSDILAPFAQVCVGHWKADELPEGLTSLRLARTKKVGQAFLSFYFRLESQDGETKSYISGEF